ncbi:substrate-binding periplasmic protein [Pseudomonas sp. Gutcm_11s]|uniref:substrate-binding periplasmic protein n=1 Tax=Pseudomonas sp. Gutcm_11s TaxID=3026088 RepID=UPI002360E797|nr:transporter substrate-binding domain-containing protein [Pseudomonas sp. Gutcm_11s]MDD0841339.1 transporter substrate-binding domain-containing protein [Pseudomonas sp. Gutcm_11s]
MSHFVSLRCLPLVLALLAPPCAQASPEPVQAFNTYETAPFLIDARRGLVPEMVGQLNQLLADQYHIELRNLPRARLLQQYLHQPARFEGLVMLLSPSFVDDAEQQTYLWSKPLLDDYNVLVLRAAQAPAQLDNDWLQGRRLLAVRGQRLPLLDELVASGQVSREDFNSELQTLQMVAAGRGDFTHMNHLMYRHLVRKTGLGERLIGIPVPGVAHFQRRILVGRGAAELLAPLNAAIDALHCQPEWHRTATRYGFTALPCAQPDALTPARN